MYGEEENVEGNRVTPKQFSLSTYQLAATTWGLVAFFGGEVAAPGQPDKVPPGKELVVTAGQECIIIIVKSAGASMASTAVEELLLTQEEADTRLILHARHAAVSGYETVLIRTRYTDVAIIACSVSHVIPCT